MAYLFDLAAMSVTGTPGTGTITLGSAATINTVTYLSFAAAGVPDGAVVSYSIADTSASEVGFGTYTAAGTTLARTKVIASTNSNNAISATSAAIVRVSALAQDFGSDYRNILFANGGMEIWQRGAGGAASIAVAASSTTGVYTTDRWYLSTGANGASVVSQQTGLISQSQFCARVQKNSGQTGTTIMRFAFPFELEECVRARGQYVTLQFYCSTGANWSPSSGTLNYILYTGTGTNGKRNGTGYTGEATPITSSTNLSTSAAATQFIITSTTTVATTTTQMELQFNWTPVGTAGANDWISIDDVQLEVGGVATSFERTSFRIQLTESQRHYAKTFSYATAPAQNAGTTNSIGTGDPNSVAGFGVSWRFPVQMRTSPTITVYSPSAASTNWAVPGGGSASTVNFTGADGTLITGTATAGGVGPSSIHAQADAGL